MVDYEFYVLIGGGLIALKFLYTKSKSGKWIKKKGPDVDTFRPGIRANIEEAVKQILEKRNSSSNYISEVLQQELSTYSNLATKVQEIADNYKFARKHSNTVVNGNLLVQGYIALLEQMRINDDSFIEDGMLEGMLKNELIYAQAKRIPVSKFLEGYDATKDNQELTLIQRVTEYVRELKYMPSEAGQHSPIENYVDFVLAFSRALKGDNAMLEQKVSQYTTNHVKIPYQTVLLKPDPAVLQPA